MNEERKRFVKSRKVAMHKTFLSAGCLLLCAGLASAQSLAELAKKEKERREKIAESEAAKVITAEELTKTQGEESKKTDSETTDEVPQASSRGVIAESPKPSVTFDSWDDTFAQYREAYQEAKAHLKFAQDFQRHCEEGTPPPPMPRVPGGYWVVNCEGVPESIAEIRNLMTEIQEECLDQARRNGIPPGRARLR